MDRYRTTTALPFAHLSEATSKLRAELGRQVVADDTANGLDWSTLRVVGPFESFDPSGMPRFEYRGSVEPRRLAALPNHRAARSLH